jgi:hypothetical protein
MGYRAVRDENDANIDNNKVNIEIKSLDFTE